MWWKHTWWYQSLQLLTLVLVDTANVKVNRGQRLVHYVALLLGPSLPSQQVKPRSELQGRQLSADLQGLDTGTDTHACSRQKVKPCMQQRCIHTSFGGSLSLSRLSTSSVHNYAHTAASDCARLVSSERHSFIYIMFTIQEDIIHVKQLLGWCYH